MGDNNQHPDSFRLSRFLFTYSTNQSLATCKARLALLSSISNWPRFDYLDRYDLRQVPRQNTLGRDATGMWSTSGVVLRRDAGCIHVWSLVHPQTATAQTMMTPNNSPFRPSRTSFLGIDVTWSGLNCQRSTTNPWRT